MKTDDFPMNTQEFPLKVHEFPFCSGAFVSLANFDGHTIGALGKAGCTQPDESLISAEVPPYLSPYLGPYLSPYLSLTPLRRGTVLYCAREKSVAQVHQARVDVLTC